MQISVPDIIIVIVYLLGVTIFGCSFYFKKIREMRTHSSQVEGLSPDGR